MDLKKILSIIGGGVLLSSGLAYSFSNDLDEFSKYFVLGVMGYSAGVVYFSNKKKKDDKMVELEALLEKKETDDRVVTLEKMLQEADGVMVEQEDVIKNYEMMLDEASVQFPCNCGQNMFDGIFKPEQEFVVECDHCRSKYAITLKLDSVLITEPIEDLNIDNLIRKNTND